MSVELDASGIQADVVEAIDREGTPVRRWPEVLRTLYEREVVERLYREEYFLFLIGLLVALSTVAIDLIVNPEMAKEGIMLRVFAIAPITIFGLIAGARGWTRALAFFVGASPIAFVAVIVHLSFHLPPEYAPRYMNATILLIGLANIVLPYSLRGLVIFDLSALATVAAMVLVQGNGLGGHIDTLAIITIVSVATLTLAGRFERLRQRNFLLNLRTRIANRDLAEANESLRNLSESDPLTGIANRRGFEKRFERDIVAPGSTGRECDTIALFMIDLDHFKAFNDTHGHQSGDYCLSIVAATLEQLFAEEDGIVGRYGGEEFIAAVRKRELLEVRAIAEDVRREIAGLLTQGTGKEIPLVTASIGVGMAPAGAKLPREELIEMADAALYCGKDQGRNRVEFVEAEAAFR